MAVYAAAQQAVALFGVTMIAFGLWSVWLRTR